MDKPYYPFSPIGGMKKLALTLGVSPLTLENVSHRIADSYYALKVKTKSGKERQVYDPKGTLRLIQKRINSRIFEKVVYPSYLTGGLRDDTVKRGYIRNAAHHAKCQTLINLDVKNFYDSISESSVNKIYTHLFKFPPDVSELLTKLTTLNGRLPQGACTSSYLANLVFYNSEYSIVSDLRNRGITYTRLLDDVAISSDKRLDDEYVTAAIKRISAMVRKHGLRLNNKKTRIAQRDNASDQPNFEVTGLWVLHGVPKMKRKDRRHVRQLVHVCEREYVKDCTAESYHKLWNSVSGKVAKLSSLGHAQAMSLRKRLQNILPTYSNEKAKKIRLIVKRLAKVEIAIYTEGHLSKINRVFYELAILGRTDKALAKDLRQTLRRAHAKMPSRKSLWV